MFLALVMLWTGAAQAGIRRTSE